MILHLQSYLKLYHAYRIRLILQRIIHNLPWVGMIFLILSFYRLSLAWLVMVLYLCVLIWRAFRRQDQDQIVRALDQDLKQEALFEAGFQMLMKQHLNQHLNQQNYLTNNINPKSFIQQEIQKILLDELWEKLCICSQKQGKDLISITQWEACQWLILENHLPNFTKIPIERILLIFIFAFAQTTLRWEVDQLNWQEQSQDQIASQNPSNAQSNTQSNSQSKTLKYKQTQKQKPFQHKTSDQSDLVHLKSKPKTDDQNDSQAKDLNVKDQNTKTTNHTKPNPKPNPKLMSKANSKSKSSENEVEQSKSSLKAKQSQKPSSQSLGELTTVALPSKESNDLNPRSNQQSSQIPQVTESSEATQSIKNFTIDRKITYYPIKQQASLKKYIQSNQQ